MAPPCRPISGRAARMPKRWQSSDTVKLARQSSVLLSTIDAPTME